MRKRLVFLCWLVAVLLISHVAIAQYAKEIPTSSRVKTTENTREISKSPICFVTIKGQGGTWPPEDHGMPQDKTLEAYSFSFEIGTGAGEKKQIGMTTIGTEQKQHGQLTITTMIGPATIGLYNAWMGNKELSEVKIDFFRTSPDTRKEIFYSITLHKAKILNINQFSEGTSILQDISFTFVDVGLHQTAGGDFKESPGERK